MDNSALPGVKAEQTAQAQVEWNLEAALIQMDADGIEIREFVNRLKEYDPKLKRRMQTEMRRKAKPFAEYIEQQVNQNAPAPLSGLDYPARERLDWDPIKAKIATSLSAGRGRAILAIKFIGTPNSRMFAITETAGSRSTGATPQGKVLIRELNERHELSGARKIGGRFGFKAFLEKIPDFRDTAVDIIDKYTRIFERGENL